MAKNWKRWLFLCVAVVMAGALLAGCGGETTTTTETTQPSPETTAAPTETTAAPTETTAAPTETTLAPKSIKLKYSEQNPEAAWSVQNASLPWLADLETATKGQLDIQTFFGETLSKGTDAWESIKAGIADFGWCFHGYWAGMTSLADVIALPFMPVKSAEQASGVLWQLYSEFPAMQKQFSDNHIITLWTSSPYYLLTTKPESTARRP